MKKIIWGIILVGIAVYIYYSYNPSMSSWFPKCPFKMLTGWQCPGCGSQRAIHSLLHLDIAQAFRYNAFLVCCIPLLILLAVADFYRTRAPRFYLIIYSARNIWTFLGIVLCWTIGRNLAGI